MEMAANCSHWIQPLARILFGPFKTCFNHTCQKIMRTYSDITANRFSLAFSKKYEIKHLHRRTSFRGSSMSFNPPATEIYFSNSLFSIQQQILQLPEEKKSTSVTLTIIKKKIIEEPGEDNF